MVKVVYNTGSGDFTLSEKAQQRLQELIGYRITDHGLILTPKQRRYIARHDPRLVQVVEELGEDVNGFRGTNLQIERILGTQYRIETFNGVESVVVPEDEVWIDADDYASIR